ncbi:MAG TPA: helicase-related protein [Mycobacterium sp.]
MATSTIGRGFAPGSVVVVRDEEWLVTATEQTAGGLLIYGQGLSELVRDTTASFYDTLDDIEALDPAAATVVADDSPRYRSARLWLESTYRKTAVPIGDRSLTVSTRALADALIYQQSAVRQALDPANLRPRILLADAVGLGKTLEIGMILAELVRRGRGDRILIVTPRHVLEQMQHEMWTRFALPFVRLDSAGIQRVRQKLPATRNPFTYFRRVIISIDTLKSDRYVAALSKQRWDAVVIDESHNLSNSATQNNRLARLLAANSEALILASATPHNGRADSFAQLIRLLDPSAVRPDGTLVESEIRRLVIRRHRHSPEVAAVVGADWAERLEPRNILITPTAAEDAIAHELERTWLFPPGGRSPYSGGGALFGWTLAKAFLSSPSALAETVAECRRRIRDHPDTGAEEIALQRLADLTTAALAAPSAKYEALVGYLKSIGVGRNSAARAVVFAERVATLRFLTKHLPASLGLPERAVAIMHGGLTDEEQQRVVDEFKQAGSPIRVLVTGDVASEGVNLHAQCHHLIHYDIPWSLIRIEQRNGRIDRYGQRFPPQITTLLLDPSSERFAGDIRVLSRLIDREHEAHTALGDAASLMGRYSVSGEEDEIRSVLAGEKDLDEVVRAPGQVAAGDDLTGLFARLFQQPATSVDVGLVGSDPGGSGLYPDEISYLEEALHAGFIDPSQPLSNGGVRWRRDPNFGTAELDPPPDLLQRLEVLPQSYLTQRRVTQRIVLATTAIRGQDRLTAALADDEPSSWPDAHYLGPLHPVLDWAADRALTRLGRGEVFAVRGDVDDPTVLLVGTLTNRRGQVVSAAWLTVAFPGADPGFGWVQPLAFPGADPGFGWVQPHGSAADALSFLGLDQGLPNPGAVPDVPALQQLIRPAVGLAAEQMRSLFGVAERDVTGRVQAWSQRLDRWDHDADALIQRNELKQRRVGVAQERALIAAMEPDQQLVRPLLVVVPDRDRS